MKKETSSKQNVLRWVALLPSVCIAWWLVVYICSVLDNLFFAPHVWEKWGMLLVVITFVVLPSIAMFFVAKYIAPKYKIQAGVCAVILCVIWNVLLFYGMSHMAY